MGIGASDGSVFISCWPDCGKMRKMNFYDIFLVFHYLSYFCGQIHKNSQNDYKK